MQTCGDPEDGVFHVRQMITKLGGQNTPVFDTGQNIFDHNARLRNLAVMGLLLVR